MCDDIAVRRGLWSWWVFTVAFVIGLVSLAFWLRAIGDAELSRADQIASVLGGYIAVAAFSLSVLSLIVKRQGNQVSGNADAQVCDAASRLVKEVYKQWVAEAELRQVRQPAPLQVRWSSTGRPVAADRDVVLKEPGADWQQMPLAGDVDEIVEKFQSLPRRQLVVIGEPGAGKSVLVMLLTLGLIKVREENQPVPVLLSIASWDPTLEDLQGFVTRRLSEDYQFLTARDADGCSLADRLVEDGLVLPILDGLDELRAEWHVLAVGKLDKDRSLVLTCRSDEYQRAITRRDAELSRAAVVEIEPVDVEMAIRFLSYPKKARARWQRVFDHLRLNPNGPLATVLSTPLMVALARTAYRNPDTKPTELLPLLDQNTIANSLIKGFVSSTYLTEHVALTDDTDAVQTLAVGNGAKSLRVDPAARASRQLGCLAYHLSQPQTATSDLMWWQISPGLLSKDPERTTRWIKWGAVLVAGLTAAFVAGLLDGLDKALPTDDDLGWPVKAGITAMVIVGVNANGMFRSLWPRAYPPYISLRYRSRWRQRLTHVGFGVTFGWLVGLMAGSLIVDLLLGLGAGAVYGFVTSVLPVWSLPPRARRSHPGVTLSINRRRAATAAAQHGLTAAAVFAAVAAVTPWTWQVFAVGPTASVVYGTAAALGAGMWTWIQFRLTHARLVVLGWLPWRLFAFLDDAHQKGVLRQAGTAWQFRHALLQDHLAYTTYLCAYGGDHQTNEQADDSETRVHMLATQHHAQEGAEQRHAQRERQAIERSRTRTVNQVAAWRLASLLAYGRVDEVIAILRARADDDVARVPPRPELVIVRTQAGDEWRFVSLLAEQGRVGEAVAALRIYVYDTVTPVTKAKATEQLADLFAEYGRVEKLRERGKAGDPYAAARLLRLLTEQSQTKDLRALAKAGFPGAAEQLARLLIKQGRLGELRGLVMAGDSPATEQLLRLLAEQGRLRELRDRANANGLAAELLADLLADQGDVNELRERFRSGDKYAARRLARLRAEQGRVDEGIAILRARADAGDWHDRERLARLLTEHDRVEEAITILHVHGGSSSLLNELLAEHDNIEELRARANAGDWRADNELTKLLAKRGQVEELRARADAGHFGADLELTRLLALQGQVEELRAQADSGNWYAPAQLASLLATQGQVEELRSQADSGNWYAAAQLASLLATQGQVEEVRSQADSGNWYAAAHLARLLAERGQVEELRARANAGDWYATEWLVVQDVPFPWGGVISAGTPVSDELPSPAPVPPSGPQQPHSPSHGFSPVGDLEPKRNEPSVLVAALRLLWHLGFFFCTTTTLGRMIASFALGGVIGATVVGLIAQPGFAASLRAILLVLLFGTLAESFALTRKEPAAWVVQTWNEAPPQVRAAAFKLLVLVVPTLFSTVLATVLTVLTNKLSEPNRWWEMPLGFLIFIAAGVGVMSLLLKIVSMQARRWLTPT